ncbi:DUF2818 family protein [Herminiimonas sp. CN]|uniref:DUF2818 family protein n=1 Tax=Herminiimonas sp. CN TaxID=1349818 RepID=UPI000473BEEF|nr:DUF2818 family protein [Herminiimonas sp. CN]
MNVTFSVWLMIILAIFTANMPFLNERLLALIPIRISVKPFWLRLIEMVVLYFTLGFIARLLEANLGNVFEQKWEFFAVTSFLFLVLAYPGFVLRYLRK